MAQTDTDSRIIIMYWRQRDKSVCLNAQDLKHSNRGYAVKYTQQICLLIDISCMFWADDHCSASVFNKSANEVFIIRWFK